MKINWHKNPLYSEVLLSEQEKRELWWKIRSEEMQDLLYEAHFRLKEGPHFNIEEARNHVKPDYYLSDTGKTGLDKRADELLAHFIEELAGWHVGDCTCVACPCSKCHAESLLGIDTIPGLSKHAAYKIRDAFGAANSAALDDVIEQLRDYEPTPPADVESWNKVGGWDKHVPRWRAEAAGAYEWLLAYRERTATAKPTPCAGSNCGTTTAQHSRECIAEHAAAVAGGRFVKVPAAPPDAVQATAAELLNIARSIEGLKLECGMEPDSLRAIQNRRYMGISYRLRSLAAALQGDGNADQAGK